MSVSRPFRRVAVGARELLGAEVRTATFRGLRNGVARPRPQRLARSPLSLPPRCLRRCNVQPLRKGAAPPLLAGQEQHRAPSAQLSPLLLSLWRVEPAERSGGWTAAAVGPPRSTEGAPARSLATDRPSPRRRSGRWKATSRHLIQFRTEFFLASHAEATGLFRKGTPVRCWYNSAPNHARSSSATRQPTDIPRPWEGSSPLQ
mmetsp:Transcript_66479/g.185301  ORF Transcript_66479/g.185301 Transcript_66479/m.185301 type:complete len:203 (+) Transcript_66479:1373-1981(+)